MHFYMASSNYFYLITIIAQFLNHITLFLKQVIAYVHTVKWFQVLLSNTNNSI